MSASDLQITAFYSDGSSSPTSPAGGLSGNMFERAVAGDKQAVSFILQTVEEPGKSVARVELSRAGKVAKTLHKGGK